MTGVSKISEWESFLWSQSRGSGKTFRSGFRQQRSITADLLEKSLSDFIKRCNAWVEPF